jgi:hypothetical protein
MRWLPVAMMIFCLAASIVWAEPETPAVDRVRFAPVDSSPALALQLAPECDRAVRVRLDGAVYAVAVLHTRWRLAVVTYAVQTAAGTFQLTAAFNHDGVLAEVSTTPPDRMTTSLCEACLGIPAGAIQPAAGPHSDPLTVISAAAAQFHDLLTAGRLERAVGLALTQAETVTGAAP